MCVGDKEEWDQQCVWHSELVSSLDKLDVCLEQLQQDQEKWATQGGAWAVVRIMASWSVSSALSLRCYSMLLVEQTNEFFDVQERKLRLKELWEQTSSRQTEMEAALSLLHFVRQLSQLRADTAQVRATQNTKHALIWDAGNNVSLFLFV